MVNDLHGNLRTCAVTGVNKQWQQRSLCNPRQRKRRTEPVKVVTQLDRFYQKKKSFEANTLLSKGEKASDFVNLHVLPRQGPSLPAKLFLKVPEMSML